jgi:hypothetical protein
MLIKSRVERSRVRLLVATRYDDTRSQYTSVARSLDLLAQVAINFRIYKARVMQLNSP